MTCPHPACTGVHDNTRFSELCPRSRERKREKDRAWQWRHPDKVYAKNTRYRDLKWLAAHQDMLDPERDADILAELALAGLR